MKRRHIKDLFLTVLIVMTLLLAAAAFATLGGEGRGTGRETDPYLIATSADLADFRDAVNRGSVDICAKLTADIDLGGVSGDATTYWTPIGDRDLSRWYSGTFDGQGHMVTGLYVNGPSGNDWGLFGATSGDAVVKNLTVSGYVTTTGSCAGIIVGYNKGTIENCTAHGSVTGTNTETGYGGLAGYNDGSSARVLNCFADAAVSGYRAVGGIVGYVNNYVLIANCHAASPRVIGTGGDSHGIGGIVGENYTGAVINCLAACGEVIGTGGGSYNIGGIAGSGDGSSCDISYCTASCDVVSGDEKVGGIVGYLSDGVLTNSVSTCSTVTGNAAKAWNGAIVGYAQAAPVTNCGWRTGAGYTALPRAFGRGSTGTPTNVISYDTNVDKVAMTCLPDKYSLTLTSGTSDDIELKTYPAGSVDVNIQSASPSVSSPDIATAGYSGGVITVTANTLGSALISSNITFKPTWLSGTMATSGEVTLNPQTALTVRPISVSSVTISPDAVSIVKGGTSHLTAAVLPSNATNKAVTWASSNTGVATVDASGDVTAVEVGSADITVTTEDGAKTGTCRVTVTAAAVRVDSVSLNESSKEIKVGGTFTLIATVSPDTATDKSVSWSTSDSTVATVDNGTVAAIKKGTATITVTTTDGSKTAECAITVSETVQEPFKPVDPNIADKPEDVQNTTVAQMTNIEAAAAATGVESSDLTTDEAANVVTKKEFTDAAAKDALADVAGVEFVSATAVPIAQTSVTTGNTATFAFEVKGDKLFCDKLANLKVIKIFANGTGELFKIAATSADFKDQYVTILKEGKVCADAISSADTYTLCAFVKDGGSFDLDGKENGKAVDPIAVVETKESPKPHSSSSGCSAGFAALALLAVPFIVKRKK